MVPSFFKKQHQAILKGLSKKLNKGIESQGLYISSFIKNKDGYINPVNLFIKPNPYVKVDFSFIAIIRPAGNENHHIIINKLGEVVEQSQFFIHSIGEK